MMFMQTGVFGEVAGKFAERIFSGILWFGIAVIIIVVVGFLMWFYLIYKRKFDIEIKIISQRAGDKDSIIFDKAAILTDRQDKSKYLRLWSLKYDLPIPSFNILQRAGKGDYLEIYRSGEDRFYYLQPPKIDKKELIRADGKLYPFASQTTRMIDPEMAFWAIKRKTMNKKVFDPEKLWMKILPYIPHIISGVLIIFILWILMSHLPNILTQLEKLAETVAQGRRAEVITGLWHTLV